MEDKVDYQEKEGEEEARVGEGGQQKIEVRRNERERGII